jgi:hypothetical protein
MGKSSVVVGFLTLGFVLFAIIFAVMKSSLESGPSGQSLHGDLAWETIRKTDLTKIPGSQLLKMVGEPDNSLVYPSSEIQKLPPAGFRRPACTYDPCHEYW